jgi:hypothetical protein
MDFLRVLERWRCFYEEARLDVGLAARVLL